jgi:hypothetical protein
MRAAATEPVLEDWRVRPCVSRWRLSLAPKSDPFARRRRCARNAAASPASLHAARIASAPNRRRPHGHALRQPLQSAAGEAGQQRAKRTSGPVFRASSPKGSTHKSPGSTPQPRRIAASSAALNAFLNLAPARPFTRRSHSAQVA